MQYAPIKIALIKKMKNLCVLMWEYENNRVNNKYIDVKLKHFDLHWNVHNSERCMHTATKISKS